MNLKSLEKRLYQLIISRLDGERVHSEEYREEVFDLVDKGIGGFILFGGEREEIRAFIERLQSLSEIPLFIASDIERGVGQQIKGSTVFPCQMAVCAAIWKERRSGLSLKGSSPCQRSRCLLRQILKGVWGNRSMAASHFPARWPFARQFGKRARKMLRF